MPKCPSGKITRVGYTKKQGSKTIRVKSGCIRSTSQSGKKRSSIDKKKLSSLKKMHSAARKKFGTPKCGKGEIIREGYHRKGFSRKSGSHVSGKWVKPTCIKSTTGRPHGEQLFVLNKGTLGQFGYHDIDHMTVDERHNSLRKAMKKLNPLTVAKKLTAISTLNKRTKPSRSKKFKEDERWVKTTKEYANRPTSR